MFNLIRIQGMTQPEAAEIVGVSAKTIQRRACSKGTSLFALAKSDVPLEFLPKCAEHSFDVPFESFPLNRPSPLNC